MSRLLPFTGLPDKWLPGVTYLKNALVLAADGTVYACIQQNAGHDPQDVTTHDVYWSVSRSLYLPLDGGTMTGTIKFDTTYIDITNSGTSNNLTLSGGTDELTGSTLVLSGKDSENAGNFSLNASDGTNTSTLKGTPSGDLTWNDSKVITESKLGATLKVEDDGTINVDDSVDFEAIFEEALK